jgi:hypothetical protein
MTTAIRNIRSDCDQLMHMPFSEELGGNEPSKESWAPVFLESSCSEMELSRGMFSRTRIFISDRMAINSAICMKFSTAAGTQGWH